MRRVLICIAVSSGLMACGPDLSAPGETDVSGTWHTKAAAGPALSVTVQLVQSSAGTITGTWAGTIAAGQNDCPFSTDCALHGGTVAGFNSALQVRFDIGVSGTFTGQMVNGSEMRGTLTRNPIDYPITFIR